MAHYAFLDENNIVTEVITGKDETDLDSLPNGFTSWEEYYSSLRNNATCKRTSYNTFGNSHNGDGVAFRGNYAGIGFTYDDVNDVFIPEKNYPSFVLNENTWLWEPPIPMPELTEQQQAEYNYYSWDEDTVSWVLISSE